MDEESDQKPSTETEDDNAFGGLSALDLLDNMALAPLRSSAETTSNKYQAATQSLETAKKKYGYAKANVNKVDTIHDTLNKASLLMRELSDALPDGAEYYVKFQERLDGLQKELKGILEVVYQHRGASSSEYQLAKRAAQQAKVDAVKADGLYREALREMEKKQY